MLSPSKIVALEKSGFFASSFIRGGRDLTEGDSLEDFANRLATQQF
jgi:hypothetical protein